MREIKFRVWDIISRKMLSDIDLWGFKYGDIFPHTPDQRALNLMQFTGLKDKNGVEIYEGDILENGWNDDETGEVTFEGGSFYLGFGYVESLATQAEDSKIIGNIYENPELLGKSE